MSQGVLRMKTNQSATDESSATLPPTKTKLHVSREKVRTVRLRTGLRTGDISTTITNAA